MKISLVTALFILFSSISFQTQAQTITDTYKFGSKKGQEIRSIEGQLNDLARQRTDILSNILEQQKLIASELQALNSAQEDNRTTNIMLQLIKELATATRKQNTLLEQILAAQSGN